MRRTLVISAIACLAALAACKSAGPAAPPQTGSPAPAPGGGPGGGRLGGTAWQLVEFRSSDDAIGVVRPDDPAKYTMTLAVDGRVSMQLNCNRANGTWTSKASGAESGAFSFGPLAMTRALCPPPSLDTQIARDAGFVRSYVLRDGRLHLNLMADGGTYTWEPRVSPRAGG